MFIEHDLAGPVLISVQMWLHLSSSVPASVSFRLLLPSPQLGYKPLKKTSKLEISVLTNVIAIFNMPVNIDGGEQ